MVVPNYWMINIIVVLFAQKTGKQNVNLKIFEIS